jgi:hypothetical protein
MSKLKVSAIHDPDNDNEALTIDTSGNVTFSGTVTGAMPDAIDVNASAPADSLSIDASGNVGVGTSSPARKLHLKEDTGFCALAVDGNASANSAGVLFYQNGVEKGHIIWDNTDNALQISGQASNETDLLKITSDGRGLSQFTAKAWVNFDGSGTVSIRDSHNVSSITDHGVGEYTVNFTNAMGNGNYSATALVTDWHICLNATSQMTTTSCRFYAFSDSTGSRPAVDVSAVTVQIFGD